MEQVVFQYLRQLKIPVSQGYLQKLIASHPAYPSLLSVADTLEGLGIDHKVGKPAIARQRTCIKNKRVTPCPFCER